MDTRMKSNSVAQVADWDAYSGPFTSVMPNQMLQLNEEVTSHMVGNVADFGCGGGKIIPFLLTKGNVKRYTGIDSSEDMIARARWMASQYDRDRAVLIHNWIQEVELTHIDSALSINSFYVWPSPTIVLEHIYKQLNSGSVFVMATINPSINMPELLEDAEKELIAHPHWAEFKRHNLEICTNKQTNFVTLDYLIAQLRDVGLNIQEAHQKLYGGGLNFIVCRKP